MKKIVVFLWLGLLPILQISCSGVKNVSGTLTKSGTGQRQDYSHGKSTDYTKVTPAPAAQDTARSNVNGTITPVNRVVSRSEGVAAADSYKKDYGRMAGVSPAENVTVNSSSMDAKDKLLNQYADMDRLADLVLYELNIVERRWEQLLEKFKTASKGERDKLSADLDQLSADQLKLYKAHVKIYKEGKSDWERTKKDVESTLLAIRGISGK